MSLPICVKRTSFYDFSNKITQIKRQCINDYNKYYVYFYFRYFYWEWQQKMQNEHQEPRNEHPYNPRYVSQFNTPSVTTVCHDGTESISFLRPKIWNLLPNELKNIQKGWKLSKIELKVRTLKTVLVEFVRFTSAMLEKMLESSLFKVLRFHAFFGYCVTFYLTIWNFDLLFMILIYKTSFHFFSWIHFP